MRVVLCDTLFFCDLNKIKLMSIIIFGIDEHELFRAARGIHLKVLEGYRREYLGEYHILHS